MIQLTYVSKGSPSLGSVDIFQVIEASARNNLRDDLTGFLIFSKSCFFQVVEGPELAIQSLFARLSTDPRHCDIEVLISEQIAERSFPKWRMKRIAPAASVVGELTTGGRPLKLPVKVDQALSSFLSPPAPAIAI